MGAQQSANLFRPLNCVKYVFAICEPNPMTFWPDIKWVASTQMMDCPIPVADKSHMIDR